MTSFATRRAALTPLRSAFLLLLAAASSTLAAHAEGRGHTFLSDLPSSVREGVREQARSETSAEDPQVLLDLVFRASDRYSFSAGGVSVQTDRRWYATAPAPGAGAPLLELHRWPGDTVLALYALQGGTVSGEKPHPVAGGSLEPGSRTREGEWRWETVLSSPYGTCPAVWIERSVPDASKRIGALMVAGDAGLGVSARSDLREELQAVFSRVVVDAAGWKSVPALASDAPATPPRIDAPCAEGAELGDPWQVITGVGWSIGLPPGLRAQRLDIGVAAPTGPVSGAVLWLRGRYTDAEGAQVVVGDETRGGYVAEVGSPDKSWISGERRPLAVREGKRVAREEFDVKEIRKTGSRAGWVERWSEPGFSGDWMVFRLDREKSGVEIGLPVLEGRQSVSLFWLPLTWRGPGEAPAPPPMDPAERFGIRMEPFGKMDEKKYPWSEAYLRVPGFRMAIPRTWWPSATLRSKEGFPIRIVDASGQTLGRLDLVETGSPLLLAEALRDWEEQAKPGAYGARSVYRGRDGSRLYLPHEGPGFLLEPARGVRLDVEQWDRMADSALVVVAQP